MKTNKLVHLNPPSQGLQINRSQFLVTEKNETSLTIKVVEDKLQQLEEIGTAIKERRHTLEEIWVNLDEQQKRTVDEVNTTGRKVRKDKGIKRGKISRQKPPKPHKRSAHYKTIQTKDGPKKIFIGETAVMYPEELVIVKTEQVSILSSIAKVFGFKK